MNKLIELDGSTTLFLESLRSEPLKVIVESQAETEGYPDGIINRVVRLFFDSSDTPVLHCTSYLNKSKLTGEEYRSLIEGKLPIGTVFHCYNDADSIIKKNTSITKETNPDVAISLNVRSDLVFRKRYEYWVGDREIGHICEFFNDESLSRVYTPGQAGQLSRIIINTH